ncbi:MAG: hypothetical protein AB7T22_00555 [Calditrichaceae bacterium]
MKKILFIISGISMLFFAGCQNSSDPSVSGVDESANNEAIEYILEQDSVDVLFDPIDDVSEDNFGDEPDWMAAKISDTSSDSVSYRFGRIGTRPVERTIQIIYDTDTTATAYIYKKLEGKFIVIKKEILPDTLQLTRYEKPMIHETNKIVHLKKIRNTDQPRLNWKISDISLTEGNSPENTVEIVELTIMPSDQDDVVITDPLDYWLNGVNVFTFPRWTDVTLRVVVKNSSANKIEYPKGTLATEKVLLHYGRNRRGNHARTPLFWVGQNENGNNVYEGTWTVKQFAGYHHAVVDVIDNGTILESDGDAFPYNSNTWSTPYRVTNF